MRTLHGRIRLLVLVALAPLGSVHGASAKAAKTGYAPVNGLQMYYEIHGPADAPAPPLVLIHGGDPTIGTSFAQILPLLAKTRRVIAFEQQGHGRTADVDRPFTFEQSADDAVGLLKYLNIQQADWLGYSNGGHIAFQIALSHPTFVRKLIIESAMFSREGSDPQFWESFKNAKLEDMPPELRDAYLKTSPRPQDLMAYFKKSVVRMRDFIGWTREEIQSIQAPTLVLCGDADIVRPEHAVDTFRLLPQGHLAILPLTDHMQMVQRGDWEAPIVEAFLNTPLKNKK